MSDCVILGTHDIGAMMDKVRAHYTIQKVDRKCKMATFGRKRLPGFKPEMGYGYFEFKHRDEVFKPQKQVILLHKVRL